MNTMRLNERAASDHRHESADADSDKEVGPFVLNLCPIPSHFSIPQPRLPSLTRFAFFSSLGLEGEREQCWLHMGYFPTRAEAQKWLGVLARVYPQAFVSQAQLTFLGKQYGEAEHEVVRRRE